VRGAGSAAVALGGGALAQTPQAPAVSRELRLLPIHERHVVVRTEATAPCYTLVANGIGGTPSISPEQFAAPFPLVYAGRVFHAHLDRRIGELERYR